MSPKVLAEKPKSAAKPATEARRYKNYINGQWVDSSSGKFVPNVNPANTDDIIGHAPQSTATPSQSMDSSISVDIALLPLLQHAKQHSRAHLVAGIEDEDRAGSKSC